MTLGVYLKVVRRLQAFSNGTFRSCTNKLAFHDADTDTDTDFLVRKSRVSDVSDESESMSVSVSASWNANYTTLTSASRGPAAISEFLVVVDRV